ncbi:hypothetical protein FRC12_004064 [Ceratobasidium sp. 428]|nr:hypothetical protein FRC12_004064 [Ceratobasidium sp. 428]
MSQKSLAPSAARLQIGPGSLRLLHLLLLGRAFLSLPSPSPNHNHNRPRHASNPKPRPLPRSSQYPSNGAVLQWTPPGGRFHLTSRQASWSQRLWSASLLDVLDQELLTEFKRLEQLRDVLQIKYKAQVRRRRLLIHSLALYMNGHDPSTSRRLMDKPENASNLAKGSHPVGDRLAQVSRLRELQVERDTLEAARDQAWMLTKSPERELAEVCQGEQNESSLRVSAACNSSVRQSKSSLHPRSARSSISGGSMWYHRIVFPRPPSTHAPAAVADSANTSVEFDPPIPPVLIASKRLSTADSSSSCAQSLWPGPAGGNGESLSVLSVPTPSATSHNLYTAQSELLKMLGLSHTKYSFRPGLPGHPSNPHPSPTRV